MAVVQLHTALLALLSQRHVEPLQLPAALQLADQARYLFLPAGLPGSAQLLQADLLLAADLRALLHLGQQDRAFLLPEAFIGSQPGLPRIELGSQLDTWQAGL